MTSDDAIRELDIWAARGRYVFTHRDLRKLFIEENAKTFQEGVNRLVARGILKRVARGIFVYDRAVSHEAHTLEHIAVALRRGEYNYVSLESALSEYGAISQIPMDTLTVMTTGRSGRYKTPFGTLEFTHTKRSPVELRKRMRATNRPLRFATLAAAWADLKRVGRNTHLVDKQVVNDE